MNGVKKFEYLNKKRNRLKSDDGSEMNGSVLIEWVLDKFFY